MKKHLTDREITEILQHAIRKGEAMRAKGYNPAAVKKYVDGLLAKNGLKTTKRKPA